MSTRLCSDDNQLSFSQANSPFPFWKFSFHFLLVNDDNSICFLLFIRRRFGLTMFSSQVCSVFHSHQKLSPCRWSASGRSLTGERGSAFFGKTGSSLLSISKVLVKRFRWTLSKSHSVIIESQSPSETTFNLCSGFIFALLCHRWVKRRWFLRLRKRHSRSWQEAWRSSMQWSRYDANASVTTNKRWSIRVVLSRGQWQHTSSVCSSIWPLACSCSFDASNIINQACILYSCWPTNVCK